MARNRTIQALVVGAAMAMAAAAPALAHHSGAMFDRAKPMVLTGVVREFQWTNPHSWIQLQVQGPKGAAEWSIESQSPNTLSRLGWRPSSFKPGDKVKIKVFPMRDGTNAALFQGAILADGKTLGKMD